MPTAGPGLEVSKAVRGLDSSVQMRTFNHTIFLLTASADSPARQKMACWPPAAAYLACGWCLFEGFKREGDRATHFAGYAAAAEQTILAGEDTVECKVGDAYLQLSDQFQHHRAAQVAYSKSEQPGSTGGFGCRYI